MAKLITATKGNSVALAYDPSTGTLVVYPPAEESAVRKLVGGSRDTQKITSKLRESGYVVVNADKPAKER